MIIYVAIQCGIYRHEIVGVASTLERAQELGRASIAAEPDHHHSIEIVRRTLDEAGSEALVGELVPKCGKREFCFGAPGYNSWRSELIGIEWVVME